MKDGNTSSPAGKKEAKTSQSRRRFMKNSSLLMAGAGVAHGLVTNVANAAHPFGDDTIRIGLVGCGGRGTGAASQAMNTEGPTKLVAVADAFEDRLKGCLRGLGDHADKLDVPPERQFVGFDGYKKVLECDIDLVILATPPGFRPMHFEAAVNAGKHVFMEKPVAVDAAGVRRVLAATKAAKEKSLAVAVGLQRRHEDRYRQTIQRIHDGEIGDVLLGRCYWNGGGVWTRPRKDGQTEMEYQMRNWYYFNWLCGDHITEQHIHNLDVMNWVKKGFPVSANGQGGREVRDSKEHGQIFDHHFVEFTYEDDTKLYSQCRHIKNCWNAVTEFAHGTKGIAKIGNASLHDMAGNQTWTYGKGGGGGHQQEHHDLFADLRKGILPNEGEYGAMSTMTSILGRMATYSGKSIKMDDALARGKLISPVDQYTSYEDEPPVLPGDDMLYPVPVPGKYEPLDKVAKQA